MPNQTLASTVFWQVMCFGGPSAFENLQSDFSSALHPKRQPRVKERNDALVEGSDVLFPMGGKRWGPMLWRRRPFTPSLVGRVALDSVPAHLGVHVCVSCDLSRQEALLFAHSDSLQPGGWGEAGGRSLGQSFRGSSLAAQASPVPLRASPALCWVDLVSVASVSSVVMLQLWPSVE